MKRFFTTMAAIAVTMTGTVASAQDGYRGRDGRGAYDRGDRAERRDDRRDRRAYRDGRQDGNRYGRYARGQRYRGDGAYVADYRRYGYRAPPRGYRYYRTNQGDVVLAAIATGIIASVIAGGGRY